LFSNFSKFFYHYFWFFFTSVLIFAICFCVAHSHGVFGIPDEGILTRLNLIVDGIDILFGKTFGFGTGLGQAEIYMLPYSNTGGIVNLHSFFLEILVVSGLPFFLIFVAFYLTTIRTSLLTSSQPLSLKATKYIFASCASFLVSFIIASFGPSHSLDWDFVWTSFLVVFLISKAFTSQWSLANCSRYFYPRNCEPFIEISL
jgi:teichuronic acid biosynthesis protein TuaE